MKIAAVEAFALAYAEPNDADGRRHVGLVRVRAEDGQVGWGEAVTIWPEASRAVVAVVEGLAELLVGQDALATTRLWTMVREHTW